jgi:hypothetical protein
MEYKIKNFHNEDGKKYVGFTVKDDSGAEFVIDKKVDLADGKTDEKYVEDAMALCKTEVDEWVASRAVVGKNWNPDTKKFE